MIEVKEVHLVHESGSKFYEVVSLWNDSMKRGAVIRRWGATGAKGEKKLEWFDMSSSMSRSADTVLASKKKRGYVNTTGVRALPLTIYDGDFLKTLTRHYSESNMAFANSVSSALRLGIRPEESGSGVEVEIISEEPAPEPVRAGDWASW